MADLTFEIQTASPQKLAALLELIMTPGGVWRNEELRAILEWHLKNPQALHPRRGLRPNSPHSQDFALAEKKNHKTLQELFDAWNTPLELLRQVKDFSKAQVEHPSSSWPAEISRLVYYVAIAVAIVRHQTRITRMTDQHILRAFQWALAQPWITPWIHELLNNSLRILESRTRIKQFPVQ